jgi:hypothetical protein
VALSPSPLFHRHYSSVSKVIANSFHASHPLEAEAERQVLAQRLLRLRAGYLPIPQQHKFWLFGLDVTPVPHPYAQTLPRRLIVYSPNPVAGNVPLTIGHACSTLAFLPERESRDTPPRAAPLSMRRVRLAGKAPELGVKQSEALRDAGSIGADSAPATAGVSRRGGDSLRDERGGANHHRPVGDCAEPREALDAVWEGFEVGRAL